MTTQSHPVQTLRGRSLSATQAFFVLVIGVALAFMAGVLFANANDSPHDNAAFDIFWQSWDVLERDYYYDLPEDQKMIYGAIQGLFSAVGNRYTFFVPPVSAELERQQTAGEFGGIGAYVAQNQDGFLVIVSPFPDMPAAEAGLLANDIILEVDGVTIQGVPLENTLALLRGEIGTPVTLSVYRPAEDRQFSVEITRARVELPTVFSQLFDQVGYVRLFSFNEKATLSLEREIIALEDQGATALILDLRGNPGGLLAQAVSVSDLFLDAGIVVTQRDRRGQEIVYESADGDLAESIPLVVLIDGGSASASEVVAGALRDRGRAVLIGQTSFGKGSVQNVIRLADESQLHVTTAVWFTPNQTLIDGQGLIPDVEVAQSDEAQSDSDPFIDAALDYLAEQRSMLSNGK